MPNITFGSSVQGQYVAVSAIEILAGNPPQFDTAPAVTDPSPFGGTPASTGGTSSRPSFLRRVLHMFYTFLRRIL